MYAHRIHHTVTSNHQLHLVLPPDFPVGAVEVIVVSEASSAPSDSSPVARQAADLDAFFNFLKTLPPSGRSAEEIDAQIREERDSWER